MANKVIEANDKNIMHHHIGETKFQGCQCSKNCNCNQDFTPEKYDYYTVKRENKKTTNHDTKKEAYIRWDFVNSL